MTQPSSFPTNRLRIGIRRINVTLPAVLVAEVDRDILEIGYFVSRSSVIEVAAISRTARPVYGDQPDRLVERFGSC